MATKTIEIFPDEAFIQKAMKEGRCSIHELSMKQLGDPDTAYQARELHLDVNHVRLLEGIYREQGQLAPVVCFRALAAKPPRVILADGFHRHAALKHAKAAGIRAYVIDVAPDEIEHEARMFAAMCNRRLCLPRSSADIKKAVDLLFGDGDCWSWSDSRIAAHCGTTQGTVSRHRVRFMKEKELEPPTFTKTLNGRHVPYHRDRATYVGEHAKERRRTGYRATINGKTISLGSDEMLAREAIAQLRVKKETSRSMLRSNQRIREYLKCKNLCFETCFGRGAEAAVLSGSFGYGVLCVGCDLSVPHELLTCVGRLFMIRQKMELHTYRMIILCCVEDGNSYLIEIAKKLGIEFLTPDELIESIEGKSEPNLSDAPTPQP